MRKIRKGVSKMGIAIPFPEKAAVKKEYRRVALRKTNRLALATVEQLEEMNEVTKRERGIGNITYKDVYGED